MKKGSIILATVALLATGGTTAFAAEGNGQQGTPAYTQQAERGAWMNGSRNGMMGMTEQDREQIHAMTTEDRVAQMQDQMREHMQANTNLTEEEREALIQERTQARQQPLEAGTPMGPKNGYGVMDQDRDQLQAMTPEERTQHMEEQMREHLEANTDLTEEEREALIQERIAERQQAIEEGTPMGPRGGFGLRDGSHECLTN